MNKITVSVIVAVKAEYAWEVWTNPTYIMQWNHASDDWHCPKAMNDVRVSGAFSFTMAAKDNSMSFDFAGTYIVVDLHKKLEYAFGDRKATVQFTPIGKGTKITETFDAEPTHTLEQQRQGWQAILENFKLCAESIANKHNKPV